MYELWHIGAAYVVGTAAGIGIFRHMVREDLVSRAIDTLVENDYVRTYQDRDGITHLYKWYELDDLLEDAKIRIREHGPDPEIDPSDLEIIESMDPEEISAILEELIEEEKNEKDDTP